jgi:hypothetical protein
MRSRGWLFTGGMTAGAVAGWVFAQRRLTTHRRDLFSPRPLRRLAALAYLAGGDGRCFALGHSADVITRAAARKRADFLLNGPRNSTVSPWEGADRCVAL